MISVERDGEGGSDPLKSIEETFVAMVGDLYYKVASDEGLMEKSLRDPNPVMRGLSLQLLMAKGLINENVVNEILNMAVNDMNDLVRCTAIIAASTFFLRGENRAFLRLCAQIALDEKESDLVRKAAYQSAVLSEQDLTKTSQISKYTIINTNINDFDVRYLVSLRGQERGARKGT